MAYELEGTIKVIMDIQTFGSGFTKREFVITTDSEKYPQDIKMEFVKDKTSLLDGYKPGQRVKVGFDLRGSEHNSRYYVNVLAWRIQTADGSGSSPDGGADSRSAPRQDRPRPERSAGPDRGPRGGERSDHGDRGDRGERGEKGDRGGRWDRDDDRRPRRHEEFRGGGRRSSNDDDDIDF